MHKLGRNDPCHCGSGKKYKKCCLEADETNNIARLAPQATSGPDPETVLRQELVWASPLHQQVAETFESHATGRYEEEEIAQIVRFWHSFASNTEPVIRKTGAFAAALEYMLCELTQNYVPQTVLAKQYGVSAPTISSKTDQLSEYYNQQDDSQLFRQSSASEPDLSEALQELQMQVSAIQEVIADHEFETEEEAKAFVQQLFLDGNLPDVRPKARSSVKGKRGASLLEQALAEENPGKRFDLARRAIEADPDAAEAYTLLGEMAPNLRVAAYYYREGMLAAERQLGQADFEELKGHFWLAHETRPYMRAKLAYAQTCASLLNLEEAIRHYEEMLALNPSDNQGVRDLLLLAYLEVHDYEEAMQLLSRFEGDASAWFAYSRVLAEHGLGKSPARIKSLLRKALEANRFIPAYLLGNKKIPQQSPDYISPGDQREAVYYARANYHLWTLQPKLTKLLADLT
ncbi:hypothetical protein PA598K_03228 [Paenibacillus sp. 598K]|uniref:SEC-C metal-binding domain-containing protein n=1 Tax=Paenibacillus sp. 598K TaxID=1117987 RepID=UPI000FF9D9E4|nr:SEC-C metal-binding domain-containing protein [Paenibacillus sp. 598K]GBF74859.1 hypothetical protein PA598K_03228 [Paenibacillus sp. 598K]